MQRFLGFNGRNLITVVLTVFVSVAFFSINAFAARTTVSVTNDTPYPLRAVYKAVGCVQFLSGSVDDNEVDDTDYYIHNRTDTVCDAKYVAPGDTVSYEFGGGTSGRKVWAEIYSGTPEMMISTDQDAIDVWDTYVGQSAIILYAGEFKWDLTDGKTNSCAVKGFGILHDAHVTWDKIEVHKQTYSGTDFVLFIANCGDGVVSQPEAEFVSLGECETLVRNRPIDSNLTLLQQVVGVKADNCTANAKNHGQVVSCITQELNTLLKDNVITGDEKGALTACAAHAREGF